MFSQETLLLFKELLDQVIIKASQPDFDEVCARVSRARTELNTAFHTIQPEPHSEPGSDRPIRNA